MMALKRLQPEDFFANQGPVEILQQRKALLEGRPQEFVCEPPMERDCAAVIQFAQSLAKVNPARTLRELGAAWEPDFVLLRREKLVEVIGMCLFPDWMEPGIKTRSPSLLCSRTCPGLEFQARSERGPIFHWPETGRMLSALELEPDKFKADEPASAR
jgi:hypothetical protein